jgi:hypothetical protein
MTLLSVCTGSLYLDRLMEKKTESFATGINTDVAARGTRTALGCYPERGRHDAQTIAAILDEGLVCHIGFELAGQPYVIPTTYARIGGSWHPSNRGICQNTSRAAARLRR